MCVTIKAYNWLGGDIMSVFYVFQGETYNEERVGGYVWSPKLNKSGGKNAGYTMMTNIRKGDFILHNSNGKIMSLSIAKDDCHEANQPSEHFIPAYIIKKVGPLGGSPQCIGLL